MDTPSASSFDRIAPVPIPEEVRIARMLEVESSAAFLKEAFDHAAIIAVTDARGVITSVNSRFCALSGYSEEELIGNTHRIVRSGFHDRSFFTSLYRTISRGHVWHGEICNRAKDGALYWVDTTIVPRRGHSGKIESYTAIRFDITPQKEAEEALWQLANIDALTGLPNRRKFIEDLEHHVAHGGEPLIVAMIDVDEFKRVNDGFGHDTGDRLLEAVGGRIHASLGPSDIVGRLGGDEFALILRNPALDGEDRRIARILAAAREPIAIDGERHQTSASIGTARYPDDGTTAREMLKVADISLYQAKAKGGDRAEAFTEELRRNALRPERIRRTKD